MTTNLSVCFDYSLYMTFNITFFVFFKLQHRRCSLLGIDACPDLQSQQQRFLKHGWSDSWAVDMAQVYDLLPRDERHRYSYSMGSYSLLGKW